MAAMHANAESRAEPFALRAERTVCHVFPQRGHSAPVRGRRVFKHGFKGEKREGEGVHAEVMFG